MNPVDLAVKCLADTNSPPVHHESVNLPPHLDLILTTDMQAILPLAWTIRTMGRRVITADRVQSSVKAMGMTERVGQWSSRAPTPAYPTPVSRSCGGPVNFHQARCARCCCLRHPYRVKPRGL